MELAIPLVALGGMYVISNQVFLILMKMPKRIYEPLLDLQYLGLISVLLNQKLEKNFLGTMSLVENFKSVGHGSLKPTTTMNELMIPLPKMVGSKLVT